MKVFGKKQLNDIKHKMSEDKELMNINHKLSSKKVMYPMAVFIGIVTFMGLNFVFNLMINFGELVQAILNSQSIAFVFVSCIFRIKLEYILFYVLDIGVSIIIAGSFTYKFYIANNDFNVQQKGGERWATFDEIKKQYKVIDEKNTFYEGVGGLPVCRYEDKIYIDDSSVNNIVIGMTRSGKTEMFVYIMIELYSRAKEKSSLIITDPKGELLSATKEILEERGWDVYCLNLINTNYTMQFNPLTEVVRCYREGRSSDGEEMANSVAFAIFKPDQQKGTEKYFAECAAHLMVAFILAVIEDSIGVDERKINIPNILRTFQNLSSLSSKANNEVDYIEQYFLVRPEGNAATSKFLQAFVAGDRTRGSIYSTFISKLTLFTYEGIARMTSGNSLNIEDIGFGKRPVALFLEIPESDKSKNIIATIFLNQIYMILTKRCALSKARKCEREVIHILEELGNMPEIENLDGKMTFGLGQRIKYTLFIHSFKQLNNIYGDVEQIIVDNAGNIAYVMCQSLETREKISKMLGDQTITDIVRTGEKYKLDKTFTESKIEKPLKDENELAHLLEGENIIIRNIKRKDLEGNDIKSFPIYNSVDKETAFKYRYKYMPELDPNKPIEDLGISNISDLNINDFVFKRNDLIRIIDKFKNHEQMTSIVVEEVSLKSLKNSNVIETVLLNNNINEINMETSVYDAAKWLMEKGKFILTKQEIDMIKKIIGRG